VAPAGNAYSPSSFSIAAEPGHQEHLRPITSVPTDNNPVAPTVAV
jgi:hypothetical protein